MRRLIRIVPCALLALAPLACGMPAPGDVYREFYVVMGGGKDWRVTDPEPEHEGARAFLPNPVLKVKVIKLAGAKRAELTIDRWGGHPGTTGQAIRFNANSAIALPDLRTTPAGANPLCYMSQDKRHGGGPPRSSERGRERTYQSCR